MASGLVHLLIRNHIFYQFSSRVTSFYLRFDHNMFTSVTACNKKKIMLQSLANVTDTYQFILIQ